MVEGGDIGTGAYGTLECYGSSRVNVFGGEIGGGLIAYDTCEVNISGGVINLGGTVVAIDDSQMNISGGAMGNLSPNNGRK